MMFLSSPLQVILRNTHPRVLNLEKNQKTRLIFVSAFYFIFTHILISTYLFSLVNKSKSCSIHPSHFLCNMILRSIYGLFSCHIILFQSHINTVILLVKVNCHFYLLVTDAEVKHSNLFKKLRQV